MLPSPLPASKESKIPTKGRSESCPILQGQGTQETPPHNASGSARVDAPAAHRAQCLVSSPGLQS